MGLRCKVWVYSVTDYMQVLHACYMQVTEIKYRLHAGIFFISTM